MNEEYEAVLFEVLVSSGIDPKTMSVVSGKIIEKEGSKNGR